MRVTARRLRNNPTDAERVLWRHLRRRQLAGNKFRRQQPLGGYVVDFVCLEKRLVIEVDGGQHDEKEQATHDVARTAWLEAKGFQVCRFWDHEVLQQIDVVKEAIARALGCE